MKTKLDDLHVAMSNLLVSANITKAEAIDYAMALTIGLAATSEEPVLRLEQIKLECDRAIMMLEAQHGS